MVVLTRTATRYIRRNAGKRGMKHTQVTRMVEAVMARSASDIRRSIGKRLMLRMVAMRTMEALMTLSVSGIRRSIGENVTVMMMMMMMMMMWAVRVTAKKSTGRSSRARRKR